ncbi:hypothetical protein AMECASPLE_020812 [Ameca splendens]|uniref:Uncharacterized protein n=1 Tax=Ameca splendens TaxID=208324 RepID=A0ABV0XGE8_9TELE
MKREREGEKGGEEVKMTTAAQVHTGGRAKGLGKITTEDKKRQVIGKPLPDEANAAFLGKGDVGSVFCTLLRMCFASTSADTILNNLSHFHLKSWAGFTEASLHARSHISAAQRCSGVTGLGQFSKLNTFVFVRGVARKHTLSNS